MLCMVWSCVTDTSNMKRKKNCNKSQTKDPFGFFSLKLSNFSTICASAVIQIKNSLRRTKCQILRSNRPINWTNKSSKKFAVQSIFHCIVHHFKQLAPQNFLQLSQHLIYCLHQTNRKKSLVKKKLCSVSILTSSC